MSERTRISVYPVGLLADVKHRKITYGLRYVRDRATERNWRAVRNYFNGYLAEVDCPPAGLRHTRCGRGWTRRAALSSLGRHLGDDNR